MFDKKYGRRYPWQSWFEATTFKLIKGEHFDCQIHGMVRNALQAARRYGLKISVKTKINKIIITVVERGCHNDKVQT